MPKRVLLGTVLTDASDKTVRVRVNRRFKHPLYKKYIVRSKNYLAHDETNEYKVGDQVRIQECRPLSKRKTWEVVGKSGDETGSRCQHDVQNFGPLNRVVIDGG